MKLKCLQILYSLGRGGTETTVKNYLSSLAGDNDLCFEVLVHKRVSDGYEQDVEQLGIRILSIEHYNKIGPYRYLKNLYNLLKTGEYDIVHIHMDAACGIISLVAKQAKVKKIIVHSHTAGSRNLGGRSGIVLNRFLFRLVKPICLACGADAGEAMYGDIDYTVLNNGINTKPFLAHDCNANQTKHRLGLPIQSKIILHVGRFDVPKNQGFLVELADALIDLNRDVYFVFAGKGNCFEQVREKARNNRHHERMFFLGLEKDIPALMCDSDVFVLPSLFEGFPVTLIEAQCAGLPCIASTGVTRAANLGINKFDFLDLDSHQWVQRINEYSHCEKTDVKDNIRKLDQMGYTSESNSLLLKNIYIR